MIGNGTIIIMQENHNVEVQLYEIIHDSIKQVVQCFNALIYKDSLSKESFMM